MCDLHLAVAAQTEFETKIWKHLSDYPYLTFKRLVPGAFNVGVDRANLHRLTLRA
jgi:hypothetical protein